MEGLLLEVCLLLALVCLNQSAPIPVNIEDAKTPMETGKNILTPLPTSREDMLQIDFQNGYNEIANINKEEPFEVSRQASHVAQKVTSTEVPSKAFQLKTDAFPIVKNDPTVHIGDDVEDSKVVPDSDKSGDLKTTTYSPVKYSTINPFAIETKEILDMSHNTPLQAIVNYTSADKVVKVATSTGSVTAKTIYKDPDPDNVETIADHSPLESTYFGLNEFDIGQLKYNTGKSLINGTDSDTLRNENDSLHMAAVATTSKDTIATELGDVTLAFEALPKKAIDVDNITKNEVEAVADIPNIRKMVDVQKETKNLDNSSTEFMKLALSIHKGEGTENTKNNASPATKNMRLAGVKMVETTSALHNSTESTADEFTAVELGERVSSLEGNIENAIVVKIEDIAGSSGHALKRATNVECVSGKTEPVKQTNSSSKNTSLENTNVDLALSENTSSQAGITSSTVVKVEERLVLPKNSSRTISIVDDREGKIVTPIQASVVVTNLDSIVEMKAITLSYEKKPANVTDTYSIPITIDNKNVPSANIFGETTSTTDVVEIVKEASTSLEKSVVAARNRKLKVEKTASLLQNASEEVVNTDSVVKMKGKVNRLQNVLVEDTSTSPIGVILKDISVLLDNMYEKVNRLENATRRATNRDFFVWMDEIGSPTENSSLAGTSTVTIGVKVDDSSTFSENVSEEASSIDPVLMELEELASLGNALKEAINMIEMIENVEQTAGVSEYAAPNTYPIIIKDEDKVISSESVPITATNTDLTAVKVEEMWTPLQNKSDEIPKDAIAVQIDKTGLVDNTTENFTNTQPVKMDNVTVQSEVTFDEVTNVHHIATKVEESVNAESTPTEVKSSDPVGMIIREIDVPIEPVTEATNKDTIILKAEAKSVLSNYALVEAANVTEIRNTAVLLKQVTNRKPIFPAFETTASSKNTSLEGTGRYFAFNTEDELSVPSDKLLEATNVDPVAIKLEEISNLAETAHETTKTTDFIAFKKEEIDVPSELSTLEVTYMDSFAIKSEMTGLSSDKSVLQSPMDDPVAEKFEDIHYPLHNFSRERTTPYSIFNEEERLADTSKSSTGNPIELFTISTKLVTSENTPDIVPFVNNSPNIIQDNEEGHVSDLKYLSNNDHTIDVQRDVGTAMANSSEQQYYQPYDPNVKKNQVTVQGHEVAHIKLGWQEHSVAHDSFITEPFSSNVTDFKTTVEYMNVTKESISSMNLAFNKTNGNKIIDADLLDDRKSATETLTMRNKRAADKSLKLDFLKATENHTKEPPVFVETTDSEEEPEEAVEEILPVQKGASPRESTLVRVTIMLSDENKEEGDEDDYDPLHPVAHKKEREEKQTSNLSHRQQIPDWLYEDDYGPLHPVAHKKEIEEKHTSNLSHRQEIPEQLYENNHGSLIPEVHKKDIDETNTFDSLHRPQIPGRLLSKHRIQQKVNPFEHGTPKTFSKSVDRNHNTSTERYDKHDSNKETDIQPGSYQPIPPNSQAIPPDAFQPVHHVWKLNQTHDSNFTEFGDNVRTVGQHRNCTEIQMTDTTETDHSDDENENAYKPLYQGRNLNQTDGGNNSEFVDNVDTVGQDRDSTEVQTRHTAEMYYSDDDNENNFQPFYHIRNLNQTDDNSFPELVDNVDIVGQDRGSTEIQTRHTTEMYYLDDDNENDFQPFYHIRNLNQTDKNSVPEFVDNVDTVGQDRESTEIQTRHTTEMYYSDDENENVFKPFYHIRNLNQTDENSVPEFVDNVDTVGQDRGSTEIQRTDMIETHHLNNENENTYKLLYQVRNLNQTDDGNIPGFGDNVGTVGQDRDSTEIQMTDTTEIQYSYDDDESWMFETTEDISISEEVNRSEMFQDKDYHETVTTKSRKWHPIG